MKNVLLLAVSVGVIALAATPALGGGPGAPKFVTGTEVGTTTSTATSNYVFHSESDGVLNAKQPWGKLRYHRDAYPDWTGGLWPSNPCATITFPASTTYWDVNNSANSFYTYFTGTVCELPVADSDPPLFNNTRYKSNLVEVVYPDSGQGRFDGLTGTLTTTGISTATATPGTFTDAFKTNGTLNLP